MEDNKLDHTGWQLWVDTHNKVKKAMNLMARYCRQDVDLLGTAFDKLRPIIPNFPNMNKYRSIKQITRGEEVCPNCGSGHYQKRGWVHTKVNVYRRAQCQKCYTWFKLDLKEKNPRTL